jgi:outer membrane protein OmpA-like peptidoglycan-associated protein
MRFFTLTTTAALLTLAACSNTSKDAGQSNDPSSMTPAKSAELDASPAPLNEMDAEPAQSNDVDASPSQATQQSVYTSRDPFLEPTLSAACGWDKPTVFFATDSAKVGLVGDIKMDLLATCLNNETLGDDPLVITGYADERGTDAHNRQLGLERANAVKEDLVKAGVDASRIETYSKGEYFVDGEGTLQDDRRVVIKLDK